RLSRSRQERYRLLPGGVRTGRAHAGLGALPVRSQHAVLRSCLMTAASNPQAPAPVEEVTLTIDGVEVSVPKGTLVIRAAEQVGIEIPRFCDHPLLKPAGACRQCLVEVSAPRNGELTPFPKPQTSCTLEVTQGMQVSTQNTSPVAEKAQRGQIEFLLVNHPLDCPVCDKGGECPLQNQALDHGSNTSRF